MYVLYCIVYMCRPMYVHMYVCMYVCVYICIHACMYVCIYVCMILSMSASSIYNEVNTTFVGKYTVAVVERSLIVRWVVRSTFHGGLVELNFSFQPLLLVGKSSPCGGSRFPLPILVVLYLMSDAI